MPTLQGVVFGDRVVNLVNVKFSTVSRYTYQIHTDNTDGNLLPYLYISYTDVPGGYSTYAGNFPAAPNTYASLAEHSVFRSSYYGATYKINFTPLTWNGGVNPALYGTSQYPAGFAPVPAASPTGRILRVGPAQEYATVLAAYLAATHGDDIVIDPGTYSCNAFNRGAGGQRLTKSVRFWGATEDPDDVILTNDGTCAYGCHFFVWQLSSMFNVPADYNGPGFFHVTLQRPSDDWESTFDMLIDAATEPDTPWEGEEPPPEPEPPGYIGHCPGDTDSLICVPRSTSRSCAPTSASSVIVRTSSTPLPGD